MLLSENRQVYGRTDVALLLHRSQAAQMLESCRNWLDPGLGLIKLANPAAGTGFQGQDWRGHKLEVSRTLLGEARAWHNSDGKWFVKVQRRGRTSRPQLHSGEGEKWNCFSEGVGVQSIQPPEQVALQRQMIASKPPPFGAERRWETLVGWAAVQELFCFLPACSARWP